MVSSTIAISVSFCNFNEKLSGLFGLFGLFHLVLQVASCCPKLFTAQRALLSPGQAVETKDLQQALEHAAVQAMRRLQGELVRRNETTGTTFSEMKELLEGCGVQMAWVIEDAQILKNDSIAD